MEFAKAILEYYKSLPLEKQIFSAIGLLGLSTLAYYGIKAVGQNVSLTLRRRYHELRGSDVFEQIHAGVYDYDKAKLDIEEYQRMNNLPVDK